LAAVPAPQGGCTVLPQRVAAALPLPPRRCLKLCVPPAGGTHQAEMLPKLELLYPCGHNAQACMGRDEGRVRERGRERGGETVLLGGCCTAGRTPASQSCFSVAAARGVRVCQCPLGRAERYGVRGEGSILLVGTSPPLRSTQWGGLAVLEGREGGGKAEGRPGG